MKTIYKYATAALGTGAVDMPINAQVLKADLQNQQIFLWAYVDTEEEVHETRYFKLIGTGHDAGSLSPDKHIATMLDGPFVWHLFETPAVELGL